MCRLLKVSRSGYYAWSTRLPSKRAVEDEHLSELIKDAHERSYGTYGSPRVHAELRFRHGVRCSRKRVERLMRQLGLQGIHRRRNSRPGGPKRLHPIFDDLVLREFTASGPNQLWVADITQHWTLEGWLYLSVAIDVYAGTVVGWSMSERIDTSLVISALEMAVHNRQPEPGVIHHSDQGRQYTALAFGRHLEKSGVLGSMGRVGSAHDNAMAESFFASLQTELLDRKIWSRRSELKAAIFEYIEIFYNRVRRHSRLGHLAPLEYEHQSQAINQPATDNLSTVHQSG